MVKADHLLILAHRANQKTKEKEPQRLMTIECLMVNLNLQTGLALFSKSSSIINSMKRRKRKLFMLIRMIIKICLRIAAQESNSSRLQLLHLLKDKMPKMRNKQSLVEMEAKIITKMKHIRLSYRCKRNSYSSKRRKREEGFQKKLLFSKSNLLTGMLCHNRNF